MGNSNLANLIFNVLFPKKCLGCKKTGLYLCVNCIQSIKQSELICSVCERPSIGGVTHPVCMRRFGLDGLWFLGAYEGVLRSALKKIKYKHIQDLAEVLVDAVLEYWTRYGSYLVDMVRKGRGKNWAVTVVPLHWTRKNYRGFNQAALLGQTLANKTSLQYCKYLRRVRMTRSQVGLDFEERKANIKGAFSLVINDEPILDNIILVDDVWTTGSTLKECCFVLKKAGAKKVWALTLAK